MIKAVLISVMALATLLSGALVFGIFDVVITSGVSMKDLLTFPGDIFGRGVRV